MGHRLDGAVSTVRAAMSDAPRIGIVLGSGLGGLADALTDRIRLGYEDIPGFSPSTVTGHSGELVVGRLSGIPICLLCGRIHRYEGFSMERIVFPVRTLIRWGVRVLVVTNAAGALNPDFRPGDICRISDHLNCMGDVPANGDREAITQRTCYDRELGLAADRAAAELSMPLAPGVYAAVTGPCYETPAEIRALRRLGADLVGMSTVPEVLAAADLGVPVLGLSLVTNMAAGIGRAALAHDDVMAAAALAAGRFRSLVERTIANIHARP